jgi:1,4-dihydroxy-6-naphthoate synthase
MMLSLAYSTDLDDAFMFWPLATGRMDARDFGFDGVTHARADTATLNRWAAASVHDVVAVSIAAVPSVARDYLLLPHGGSVGRDYGPVIVAREPLALSALAGRRVGVPGATTTCARLVKLAAPAALQVEILSAPLELAFNALDEVRVDACALIHEGRLTYRQRGLHLVEDLGQFWQRTRNLPIPLGGNVIKRALGDDAIARASTMLRQSIAFALEHRDEALDELAGDRGLSRAQADEYLALYANADTLDYGADGRRAIEALLEQSIEFAP